MKKSPPDAVLEALKDATRDEAKAVAVFEILRWNKGKPTCPKCSVTGECYEMKDRDGNRERNYRWRCRACGDRFTVRTGSVLEETRLPLTVWAHAFWRACASKKGVSALQISRECKISYKSALFLMHRIRFAMGTDPKTVDPLHGKIEADETFVGGKAPRFGRERRKRGRGTSKTPVMVLVQRGGGVRMQVAHRLTSKTIGTFLAENAHRSSILHTDDYAVYGTLGKYFREHHSVTHSKGEYARGDAHSNTAESVASLLKRALYGTWHSVSKHHLHRYLAEVGFRWNTRFMDDSARVAEAIRGGVGKRLQYSDAPAA